jgi:hypothetical protein
VNRRVEWGLLALILLVGAWLRFSHLELLEFKSDEAYAAQLALQFVKGGALPTAGLMSSVGVTNPPMLIYLLIPVFFVTTNVAAVSCFIAALGLASVAGCWWTGRKYYGPVAGLVAAAFFAVSPWAVIYSRKIWAQDFVPVFAVGTMWAAHALVCGKKPKAIFWVLFLPLCVVQLHFSGLALAAAVAAILLVLRPKMDWKFAVAGLVGAILLAAPYLREQSRHGWIEWRQLAAQRSGRNWEGVPPGMTIQPNSGYPLPRRPVEGWIHALAIMNGGEIEDVLGLSAGARFDQLRIQPAKGREYFATGADWLLWLQRLAFVAALAWLGVVSVKSRMKSDATILVLWCVVPLAVFLFAGLWTYLSYYAILMPALFLVCGGAAEKLRGAPGGRALPAVAGVLAAANVWFMADFYRYVGRYGGAQGTYGTGLGHKRAAAQWLAERADVEQLMGEGRLAQMDQLGRVEKPQLDLPWLAMISGKRLGEGFALQTNEVVLVVDENRTNYDPKRIPELAGAPQTNFGPMRLYLIKR